MRNNSKNTTVTSRFNLLYVFLLFFLVAVLFFLYILLVTKEEIILFLIAFMAFVLYGFYIIAKNLVFFRANSKNIKVGPFKTYNYNDVLSIDLYSSVPSKFMFFTIYEKGLTIHLKNNKKIHLKETYYSNFWKIRLFLDNKLGKKQVQESKPIENSRINITNKTTPIPFYIFGIRILMATAVITTLILLIDLCTTNYLDPGYFLFSIGTFFFTLLFTFNMGYIESSKDYIVIKKLINPFIKTVIPIEDITYASKEIIRGGRSRTTLIIIHTIYHKDFKIPIDFISLKREKNIIKQLKKLDIPYNDYS